MIVWIRAVELEGIVSSFGYTLKIDLRGFFGRVKDDSRMFGLSNWKNAFYWNEDCQRRTDGEMRWVLDRLRCYYIVQGHQKFFDNHVSLELAVCLVKNNRNSDLHIHNLKFNFFFFFCLQLCLPTDENHFFCCCWRACYGFLIRNNHVVIREPC